MKKLDLSNIIQNTRKLGAVKATLEHMQEAYTEGISNLILGLVAGTSNPVALYGCVDTDPGADFNISSGAIYHNGEIFLIDSFFGTPNPGDVPVLSVVTTYRAGDPVKYSDGNNFNTHAIRKYRWTFGPSGSGLADFSFVVSLKNKVLNDLLAAAPLDSPALTGVPTAPTAAGGTNTTQIATTAFVKAALDALIASAPGALDTLDELAAALGDDANFAATITTALAGKVPTSRLIAAGAGLIGGGDLSSDRTLNVFVDDSTVEINGDAVRVKPLGITSGELAASSVTDAKLAEMRVKSVGVQLLMQPLEIIDWNMNQSSGGSATKSIPHGLPDHSKIRGILTPIIRNDDGSVHTHMTSLENGSPGEGGIRFQGHDATNIRLYAEAAGSYDNTSYDSMGGYIRGWVTVVYEA